MQRQRNCRSTDVPARLWSVFHAVVLATFWLPLSEDLCRTTDDCERENVASKNCGMYELVAQWVWRCLDIQGRQGHASLTSHWFTAQGLAHNLSQTASEGRQERKPLHCGFSIEFACDLASRSMEPHFQLCVLIAGAIDTRDTRQHHRHENRLNFRQYDNFRCTSFPMCTQ